MKTAENSNLLLYLFVLYFLKACRITDLEERQKVESVRCVLAYGTERQREHSCNGEKLKIHSHQPELQKDSSQHAQCGREKSRGCSPGAVVTSLPGPVTLLESPQRLGLLQNGPVCVVPHLICTPVPFILERCIYICPTKGGMSFIYV